MEIKNIKVGYLSTNCYVVSEGKDCVIIDPGAEASKIRKYIDENGLIPKAILLTHGHFDHIMAVNDICSSYKIGIYAEKEEKALLCDPKANQSGIFGFGHEMSFSDVNYLEDGQVIDISGISFRVIHTPGHTVGSCCYYVQKENALFAGDTLFEGGYGRTDFPTGSQKDLKTSIIDKLFVLPDCTKVFPGHEGFTDIKTEKTHNMILY